MKTWLLPLLVLLQPPAAMEGGLPAGKVSAIDSAVHRVMARTGAKGLALAVIKGGRVRYVQAYGVRDAAGDPLTPDTVMYGASLTKTVFAYSVLQLVDRGTIALDRPLADYLDKPLPDYDTEAIYPGKYGPYRDLAGDPRWRRITARTVLTHSTGFPNFWWDEPDQKLRIHFDPGTRYSYSGEGMILLQFVIENGRKDMGLCLDLGALTQSSFTRLGMARTSLMWRPEFRPNLADGFNDHGAAVPHDERSKVRVAGSMDTTIADLSKFVAALVRNEGLSAKAYAEILKAQLPIGTAHQFPNFAPELPVSRRHKNLAAGLGVIVFRGPQGPGFFKGGHDEQTANMMVCIERSRSCVLLMSNDVRAEAGVGELVKAVLGDTGVPFDWEYGDHAGKS
ncbi:serine hydrolase [Sphingomonas sp. MAH-20]|uniref:Serine hydrolase n=2 Tax=Sphingomonas horti TaxID=2682842 RepID=A0A6I4J816_9SPHN|nr:serine hydrolase domain-containing protein [Sphingomonas sp. CGMCC 1.13658]MBA2918928.1 beta-lactamase family protein [Sphingomonas sp. CGMCC 1.13658]MVO78961.1 serine hydrolase [Sphingomonas horti]